MCILMFIPLTIVAVIAERPHKTRNTYRKRTQRTFHVGR